MNTIFTPPPVRRCSHWPFWLALVGLSLILLFSLLVNLVAVGVLADAESSAPSKGEDEFPKFSETHSYGSGTTKVVRIAYSGALTREPGGGWLASSDPVEDCIRQIRAARQDKRVAAIILEIDSPGGGVTDADEIHRELTLFKTGGYYIALPANRIIAQPTSVIGSIGVIMQTVNIHELSQKLGVTDTTIKSGANKDLLNPFQPVSAEQLALMQGTINALYDRFVQLVADARQLPAATIRPLADGRIFTAQQALDHQLIDAIGYWDDAVAATAALLDADSLRIVTYKSDKTFVDRLFSSRSPLPNLRAWLTAAGTPRRLYLWRP